MTIAGSPLRCASVIFRMYFGSVDVGQALVVDDDVEAFAPVGLSYTGMLPVVPRPPCSASVQSTGNTWPIVSISTFASPE